eukprot:g2575.t1
MSRTVPFDISQDGATVFLTGASGFVGSIILEQLLRICPDVKTVFVLFRDKRNKSAKQRLEELLSSGLFHMVWDTPTMHKVRLVKGDLDLESLGLDNESLTRVIEETTHFIHCAADVGLVEPIQKTLRSNYTGVKNVLELCKKMTQLHVYTHISTSYVNINRPQGSTVKEEIYPLMQGDEEASHSDIVHELFSLPEKDADLKAKILMERWNFPNTYCFGKHLAEKLVADYCDSFRCVIVRPSLVAGLMGDPYPGYIENLAGAASVPIAFAVGFYTRNSSTWNGASVTDSIPGDFVASTVLMASAYATVNEKRDKPLIFQSGSSTSYPLTNAELYALGKEFFTEEPPPYCLLLRGYQERPHDYKANIRQVKAERRILALKVKFVSLLLKLSRKDRVARRLKTGWKMWKYADQERYDLNLFFSIKNTESVYALLDPEEKKELKCVLTPDVETWSNYSKTYCCGVKTLLLKSPIKNITDHDFVLIPKKDPPISIDDYGVANLPVSLPEAADEQEGSQSATNDETVPKQASPMIDGSEDYSSIA